MRIKFWGTRGSISVPGKDTIIYGGNTTCVEITLESGRKIIIDAGTGIRALGQSLVSTGEKIDIHLLITHIHWDHVQGVPFFDPVYLPDSRITVDGFPSCMTGLAIPFENKMGDGFFPIKFDDLKARLHYVDKLSHGPLTIDGVTVDAIPLQHPQGGFGFRFREGKKTLVFLTDNELTGDAWADRHPEDYIRFCNEADILIHDAQYTPEEIKDRKGWGHSDYLSALDLALKAHVKELVLFHHDPSRTDSDVTAIRDRCRALARERDSGMVVNAARESGEWTL